MKHNTSELLQKYKQKVDFLEIRLENSETTQFKFFGDGLESVNSSNATGGYVRSCYKGAWGFCSFNETKNLKQYIEDAIKQAIILGGERKEKTTLVTVKPQEKKLPVKLAGKDPRTISLEDKVKLFDHYHGLLKSYSNQISNSTARYLEKIQNVTIANSDGTYIEHGWIDLEARFSTTAKKDGKLQVAQESLGSRKGFEEIENLDKRIIDTAKRSVDHLDLKSPKAGTYTVVIDPILTGLFVHEAFGHLSEGDFIFDNPNMQEFMVFGKKFGESFLNILDGAEILNHRGSYLFDDEGTPSKNTCLIKEGILVGRLHSRETAGKLGEKSTGNARCLDYRFPPIVRMTNTWIEPGKHSPEDLLSGIKLGIWAGNWLGGQTNCEMFTFASGEARMIRDGKLAEPVRDVNLTGNVFQSLKNIEGIANDMYWDESGGCGKGGQSGLAVGVGGPSIRIKDVVVPGD
ncbi:MAG: TldD/PmbA family protein [Candidatus Melainabacteria bacterium]|nr:TldD/PmbA family protein [Candidatus Melainabacteria bacterium]